MKTLKQVSDGVDIPTMKEKKVSNPRGAKNRRKGALQRLIIQINDDLDLRAKDKKSPKLLSDKSIERIKKEVETLKQRI